MPSGNFLVEERQAADIPESVDFLLRANDELVVVVVVRVTLEGIPECLEGHDRGSVADNEGCPVGDVLWIARGREEGELEKTKKQKNRVFPLAGSPSVCKGDACKGIQRWFYSG